MAKYIEHIIGAIQTDTDLITQCTRLLKGFNKHKFALG
jgi:hypothetical protein